MFVNDGVITNVIENVIVLKVVGKIGYYDRDENDVKLIFRDDGHVVEVIFSSDLGKREKIKVVLVVEVF